MTVQIIEHLPVGGVVPIGALKLSFSPRRMGVSAEHVQLLIETGGIWPPLLVQRSSLTVIDGAHRLAAARSLGLESVEITYFDGTDDQARVEAVFLNNRHGLPLSAEDRRTAAQDILGRHPQWSDGRVAEICALSPKTVAKIRTLQSTPNQLSVKCSEQRIGLDGKRHPLQSADVRARIEHALIDLPDASLRTIAAKAQASPETVRKVRLAQKTEFSLASEPNLANSPDTIQMTHERSSALIRQLWRDDTACSSTPAGATFASWFDKVDVGEADLENVAVVPLSRLYEISDEALRRARFWSNFSDLLNKRLQKRR